MKIAVTYEDGEVFQHFGHTAQFKVYAVQNGTVQSSFILETNGNGHGALGGLLKQNNIDTLICGGIGMGARQALGDAGIQLFGGVTGKADQVVADFLANKLNYNPDVTCNHHQGHHHGHHHGHHQDHQCGHHHDHDCECHKS